MNGNKYLDRISNNNTESIYFEEKRQIWRFDLRYNVGGKAYRKGLSSKDYKTLIKKIADFKIQLYMNEQSLLTDDIPFKNYAEGWMENNQKMKLKPLSYATKSASLKNQVYPFIRDIPIRCLKYTDIQAMVNGLYSKGYSYSIIKKAYNAVTGCVRYFRVTQHISFNPCEGVVLPENSKPDISDYRYFNKEQRAKIEKEITRKHSNGSYVYPTGYAIQLLMYTGLRISELSALRWKDINFEERTISVNKNIVVTNVDGRYQFIEQNKPKTKSGARIIPISSKAMEALITLKQLFPKSEYVLNTRTGDRVIPANMNRTLKRILKNAGIPSDDFGGVHTLRHTFATMLFENGCNVKIVSELLGHSSTKITEDIYIHAIQKQKVKAIEDLDKYCL